jgi:hypothetical protein
MCSQPTSKTAALSPLLLLLLLLSAAVGATAGSYVHTPVVVNFALQICHQVIPRSHIDIIKLHALDNNLLLGHCIYSCIRCRPLAPSYFTDQPITTIGVKTTQHSRVHGTPAAEHQ